MNPNCGTYFPATTTHTVSGVLSSSPGAPHSHVQNAAATSTASALIPVLDPNNHGSSTFAATSSIATNSPTVPTACVIPGYTASDSSIGIAAAIHTPTYGMNRMSPAARPHSSGLGNGR